MIVASKYAEVHQLIIVCKTELGRIRLLSLLTRQPVLKAVAAPSMVHTVESICSPAPALDSNAL